MLRVEDWAEIRRLHRSEQMPIKVIARVMRISKNTVKAALRSEGPPRYERPPRGSIRRALVLVGNSPTLSEPKTEAGRRSIPLATQAVSALRSHRRRQAEERLAHTDVHGGGDLVFAQEDGSPVHPDRFLDAFHRISKTAGLRPTRPHDLRHGWATRALEAGVPAKVVQEVLGHASAMVTLDIYSHVVPSMKADATQLVADQFSAKR